MPEQTDSKDKPKLSPKAKELLLYSKIYRFLAIGLGFFGFIVSGVIYDKLSDGSFMIFFEEPTYAIYLFLPFIPSAIFAWIAARKLQKFYKLAKKDGIDIKSLRKRSDLYSHKNVKQN